MAALYGAALRRPALQSISAKCREQQTWSANVGLIDWKTRLSRLTCAVITRTQGCALYFGHPNPRPSLLPTLTFNDPPPIDDLFLDSRMLPKVPIDGRSVYRADLATVDWSDTPEVVENLEVLRAPDTVIFSTEFEP